MIYFIKMVTSKQFPSEKESEYLPGQNKDKTQC